ncbi:helicase carboxy-terminal domain [Brachionus plicatilis]|uniref:Helicase carboxy-terminal domain n=1 Tax=Brachionus plicatilis TaxID=10195 RepID=A0A3M7QW28_BRAPC|nr:helicase carboxy-terminal domain [Brachionus plicatilis]
MNIKDLIEKNKFTQLSNELLSLNNFPVNQRILDDIRSAISSEVEQIIEDIEFLEVKINRELKYEDFENLVTKVNLLDQANKSLYLKSSKEKDNSYFQRVIDREIAQKIEKTFLSIKEKITSKLNDFLRRLEEAKNSNNFNKAEYLRENFEKIKSLLVKRVFCNDMIFQRFSSIEESLENRAVEQISKYENIGIVEYNCNELKIILEELEKIKDKMTGYMNAYNKLSNHIFFKIKQYLQNDEGSVTLEKRICFVENLTFYLTNSINEQVRLELNNKKRELRDFKDTYEKNLKEFIAKDDVRSICNLLNQDSEPKSDFLEAKKKEMHNFFLPKIDHIKLLLKENNVKDPFAKLIEIKDYFNYSTNEVIESIEERFYNKLCQLNEIFSRRYDDNDECYFQHFTSININELKSLFLFNSFLNDTSLRKIFRNDSKRNETKSLIEKIEQLSMKNSQKLVEWLEILDFKQILISLKFADSCSKIFENEQIAAHISTIKISFIPIKEIKSLVLKRLEMTCENLSQNNLLNQRELKFEKERQSFFGRIKKEFLFVKNASESIDFRIIMNTEFTITQKFENIKHLFNQNTRDIQAKALDIIKKETLSENDCNNLRLYCENLFSIDKEFYNCLSDDINLNDFSDKFQEKCDEIVQKVYSKKSTIETSVNKKIDSKIVEGIRRFKTQNGDQFLNLATHLSENENGLFILGEYDIFKGEMIRVMKEKTKSHNIDYVLEKLEGDDLEKEKLKSRYDKFKKEYDELIKSKLFSDEQNVIIDNLVSKTINLISSSQSLNNEIIKKIPSLVAHIFAVWTLKNINYFREMEGAANQESYLLQPHPAQVIAIFRILGIGYTPGLIKRYTRLTWFEQLPKNLVQVNTGEGKSVILAVTSIVLGLAGFDVSCACYSEYLSQRDYEEFKEMFELFGLQRQIFYGTFNKVCERLINRNFDLRERVVNMIKLNAVDEIENSSSIKDKKISQVLLIDEVDIFFNKDFLGNFYIPLATLKHQSISQLLKKIWQERHQIDLKQLKETDEFKECQKVFSNWMDLLNECFKDVLADLKNFELHQYKVTNDKISYMEHGELKMNIVYGYRTLFAYFNEHERGNISSDSLNDYLGLGIQCGKFSFSEIPKQFDFIFGVSGTLKNLSQKLDKRMNGTINPENYTALLAEDIYYVQDDRVNILSEDVSINERKYFIKKATTNGKITLLTRSFGRGIDFICNNKSILTNGGVHVIQTFFSEDPSEEIQIKGRTARQGESGSFSMVLNQEDLEKFFGTSYKADLESLINNRSVCATTNQKRKDFFNIYTQTIQK